MIYFIRKKSLHCLPHKLLLLITFLFSSFSGSARGDNHTASAEKESSFRVYHGHSTQDYKGFRYYSQYVTMRDSVKLAVDVFLPKRAKDSAKFPAILYQTRYVRSLQAKVPFRWLKSPVLAQIPDEEIEFFTSHGYACVVVDVRGSGASLGERTMEFSPQEVRDGYDIIEWLICQPWSDGKVASTGISYVGTTAELLLVNKHPAVNACVTRSSIFDLYNHLMFPGGVRQGPFIKIWGETTRALDENDFDAFGKRAKRLLSGINPVDGDRRNKSLSLALDLHRNNFDVYEGLLKVNFRDDKQPGTDLCSNDYSVHSNCHAIVKSGTPIYRIGGWYDGALIKSVIEGMLNTANTKRVLIGPWDHGPRDNASPYAASNALNIDVLTEILRFLDYYLKGIDNGIAQEKKIHYYTIGEEKWKAADEWPLPQQTNHTFLFSADGSLTDAAGAVMEGTREYVIDYTANSGNTSRWNSQTPLYKNGPTHYPDRREQSEKLLHFTTRPFHEDAEMTGHPIADIYLSADASDAIIFCYVEDVSPDGSVTYVTEGMFRALHRKIAVNSAGYVQVGPYHSFKKEDAAPMQPGEVVRLNFDLLPISYLFKKGHSLRISIAGADSEHFDSLHEPPSKLTVHCTKQFPSGIIIPAIDR